MQQVRGDPIQHAVVPQEDVKLGVLKGTEDLRQQHSRTTVKPKPGAVMAVSLVQGAELHGDRDGVQDEGHKGHQCVTAHTSGRNPCSRYSSWRPFRVVFVKSVASSTARLLTFLNPGHCVQGRGREHDKEVVVSKPLSSGHPHCQVRLRKQQADTPPPQQSHHNEPGCIMTQRQPGRGVHWRTLSTATPGATLTLGLNEHRRHMAFTPTEAVSDDAAGRSHGSSPSRA